MLTTVDRVKDSLVTPLPESADAFLERLILEVTGVVEDYCNRYFHYASYTETFDGTGRTTLRLRGVPVRRIISLTIDDEEIDKSDYEVNLRLGEIYYASGFTAGYQNIVVVYVAGYDYPEEEEEEEEEEDGDVGEKEEEEDSGEDLTTPAELEGAVIAEVVSRYENYTTETRSGENLVDLRTNFLTSRARDYFSRQRFVNI